MIDYQRIYQASRANAIKIFPHPDGIIPKMVAGIHKNIYTGRKRGEGFLRKSGYGPILLILLLLLSGGDAQGAVIRDLRNLRQDPLAYVDRRAADLPLLPAEVQSSLNADDDLLTFAPWHQTVPRHTLEQVTWGFKEYGSNPGYGKDGRRHPADWIRKMAVNAHLDDYPQGGFPAVTVNRIDFRVLPTRDRHSRFPKRLGGDNPFDNLQESSAPPRDAPPRDAGQP